MMNACADEAMPPGAPPLGDALAAAVESEQILAERATRLDGGDLAAAGELAGLLPERLAVSVEWLEALEGWTPLPDLAVVQQEAVNALAFQALRWRMVEESLQRALAGEIDAAIERRGASHGALLDQQQSWQLLGFALQCVAAQRPAAIADLALPNAVRAALGLPDEPPASGVDAPEEVAARLTIAAVPPRRPQDSDVPPSEPRTLSSEAGTAAETALRQLASLEPEPAWLEDARQDYIAIVRRAMGRLVEAEDGAASLLSRLATAIAGRPIDFGAATATGFGTGHDLLWGTIELDVSLPQADNGWWMLTDDERATLLVRLRGGLDWVAVAADAVVQPNVLTALDLPSDLRPSAGLTWQQRVAPAPAADRDVTLPGLDWELAAIARERDDALDAWRESIRRRLSTSAG